MKTYLLRHLQVLFTTLGQLLRTPLATLLTGAILGITLALPTGLYLTVHNLQRVSGAWGEGGHISLFLKRDLGREAAERLAERLRARPEIATTQLVSPDSALAEFKRHSGFGDALTALQRNPLPWVVILTPKERVTTADLDQLVQELTRWPEVDIAQFDLEWVRRLAALLRLAERAVLLLAGLLGLGVLLVLGNTARLAVVSRCEEIALLKLVGGTDVFIRRPFLYAGTLLGLLGAAVAWLLVLAASLLLGGPAEELAALYGSRFELQTLDLPASLGLLFLGAALGWVGTRFAIGRQLRAIEPS
jgi:cell division transport system permease protein